VKLAVRPRFPRRIASLALLVGALSLGAAAATASAAASARPASAAALQEEPTGSISPLDGTITVYLLDHQLLPAEELATIQREVEMIFDDAGLEIEWLLEVSPRRRLRSDELRLILLPSDGTRWFHGPSNVIGIAPHDDSGIGRNCFVFYRQAVWFRQQSVRRCRTAVAARTEAAQRGVEVDPYMAALAPADCGQYLPDLTARIVARAAAHEMVHILLNKLDHSEHGLMRLSFDIKDWMVDDRSPFRLGREEIDALRQRFVATGDGS